MSFGCVVLSGANGFLGSRIASRLAAEGAQIRAPLRHPCGDASLSHPNICQFIGDFSSTQLAKRVCEGAEAVVHCAASFSTDYTVAQRVNIDDTRALAIAARHAGVRSFVHISTLAVLEIRSYDAVLTDDSPLKTDGDPYGVTKALAELEVREQARLGLHACILRPAAILGAHPRSTWGTKVPEAIRAGKVPLRGDGLDRQPWVDVENLVNAVQIALAQPAAEGKTFNIVDGHWQWRRYVEEVRRWFPNAPAAPLIPFSALDLRTDPLSYFVGSFASERIRRELGYMPRRSFADGMKEAALQFTQPTAARHPVGE